MTALANTAAGEERWLVTLKDLRLPNPLNGAQWARHGRTSSRKAARAAVYTHLLARVGLTRPALPVTVTLTRISVGTLDAWDGLPASLKSVVDGCADYWGVRDSDPRLTWAPPRQEKPARGQEPAKGRVHLRIEVTRREDPHAAEP